MAVGLSGEDFQPAEEQKVGVQGLLIKGNPMLFFAFLAMGQADFVWINGEATFSQAEMKQDDQQNDFYVCPDLQMRLIGYNCYAADLGE